MCTTSAPGAFSGLACDVVDEHNYASPDGETLSVGRGHGDGLPIRVVA